MSDVNDWDCVKGLFEIGWVNLSSGDCERICSDDGWDYGVLVFQKGRGVI